MAAPTIIYDGPIVSRKAARALGERHYFTEKPCPSGHIDKRHVKGKLCFTCSRERSRIRRAIPGAKEKRAAVRKTPEARQAVKAYRDAYYASHRAEILNKKKRYRETPSGKMAIRRHLKIWIKTEMGKASLRFQRHARRARMFGVRHDFTPADDQRLRDRQKACHICGWRFTKSNPPTLDHVIPIAKGGEHTAGNILLAHLSCNARKRDYRTHLL